MAILFSNMKIFFCTWKHCFVQENNAFVHDMIPERLEGHLPKKIEKMSKMINMYGEVMRKHICSIGYVCTTIIRCEQKLLLLLSTGK
jgi:hypothetical protein